MWLLSFFSDLIIHTILIAGIIGTLVSFFVPNNPYVLQYSVLLKVVSLILILTGTFFEGTIYKDNVWKMRVAEAEAKVQEKAKLAAEANTNIQYVYIEKKQKNNEVKEAVAKNIANSASVMDAKCIIVPEAIDILNAAAKNEKPKETK